MINERIPQPTGSEPEKPEKGGERPRTEFPPELDVELGGVGSGLEELSELTDKGKVELSEDEQNRFDYLFLTVWGSFLINIGNYVYHSGTELMRNVDMSSPDSVSAVLTAAGGLGILSAGMLSLIKGIEKYLETDRGSILKKRLAETMQKYKSLWTKSE